MNVILTILFIIWYMWLFDRMITIRSNEIEERKQVRIIAENYLFGGLIHYNGFLTEC
jgi:flagellar biogenesis protein FliO